MSKDIQRRIVQYVRQYGALKGCCTFAKAICGTGPVSLCLPHSKERILVRRHTTDVAAFEQVFINGEYDLPFRNNTPRLIIDAGANVGCASIFFAKRFPSASIWAVEPERSNYSLLKKNADRFPNITTVEAAIWNSDTVLEVQNPDDDKWAFRVQEVKNGQAGGIQGLTIPTMLKKAGMDHIDIFKIDIEGAEKYLFDLTSQKWINQVQMIIIELHDWIRPGCAESFLNATRNISWEILQKGENTILIKRGTGS